MYNYYRKDHVLIGNTSRVKLPKRVAVWTYNDSNYNMISFRTSTNYKVGNRPVTVRMAVNNNAVDIFSTSSLQRPVISVIFHFKSAI